MITEIILVIFAILYYLFSVFFIATIIQDIKGNDTLLTTAYFLFTIYLSPIAVPIVLGIELGKLIKNN